MSLLDSLPSFAAAFTGGGGLSQSDKTALSSGGNFTNIFGGSGSFVVGSGKADTTQSPSVTANNSPAVSPTGDGLPGFTYSASSAALNNQTTLLLAGALGLLVLVVALKK